MVFGPKKIHFARRVPDFAGFRVTKSTIEPLLKYTDVIRDFPTPSSITDIRSWFGLVNQVSSYTKLSQDHGTIQAIFSVLRYQFLDS